VGRPDIARIEHAEIALETVLPREPIFGFRPGTDRRAVRPIGDHQNRRRPDRSQHGADVGRHVLADRNDGFRAAPREAVGPAPEAGDEPIRSQPPEVFQQAGIHVIHQHRISLAAHYGGQPAGPREEGRVRNQEQFDVGPGLENRDDGADEIPDPRPHPAQAAPAVVARRGLDAQSRVRVAGRQQRGVRQQRPAAQPARQIFREFPEQRTCDLVEQEDLSGGRTHDWRRARNALSNSRRRGQNARPG